MKRLTNRAMMALILCGALQSTYASGPAIGLVLANGSFELDHSRVWENATLFEGNVLETGVASSQLRIDEGVNLRLAAQSRARVYKSRLVLEKGIGELSSTNYRIEADNLHVLADTPGAIARVEFSAPNRVVVAAREGSVRVTNGEGVLVARLSEGREMAFEPQSGSDAAATKVSGCLLRKGGKYIIVDQTTNVTMELEGPAVAAELGNQVEITGAAVTAAPTVAGASQVIQVTAVRRVAKGGCASVAAKVGAVAVGAGAAGAAAAGISTGAIVAIVGGVAAVSATVGLAAAHDLPGQSQGSPSTSR